MAGQQHTSTSTRGPRPTDVRRRLRAAYITGLVIIAGLASAKAVVSSVILDRTAYDAALMNIAGRQRMLSQKIAKAALRYEHAATEADAVDAHDELAEAFAHFSTSHEALRYGSETLDIPAATRGPVADAYADLQPVFVAIRDAVAALLLWEETHTVADQHAPEVLESIDRILGAETRYLAGMDGVVDLHEAQANAHVRELIAAKNVLLVATLIALIIEAALVFEPAVRTLSRQMRTIDDQRHRAEGLAKHKARFLANMSHEIRTPMTAILGFADLMLEPELTPAQRAEHIQTIRANGEHLLGLINDILDSSKIEAGKLEVERVACDPRQLVEDSMSLMRKRAHDKNIDLSTRVEEPIPAAVAADPLRFRQILVNLISNAIKFTDRGSVTVTTRMVRPNPAHGGGDEQHWLQIAVADTGIGIPADAIEGIFNAFDQAERSTSRRFGGTGLGLSISKNLAEAMGGRISVESAQGRGSTFTLHMPAGVEPRLFAAPPMPDSVRGQPVSAQSTTLEHLRILLAEDGADNQRLLRFHLEKAGAQVTIVDNGQLAIEAVEDPAVPADLVLMDVQMPVMNGLVATSTLRQRGVTLPILALTANAMPEDRERCITAGCDDFLTKPIDAGKLVAACARWCKRKPRPNAA
ncbi:MAG: ATP-binding protein [Planctomycetota bacterium]